MTITTPIIPSKLTFAKKTNKPHELDLEAICVFVATGFFMGDDTYWKDQVCLKPGHTHNLNEAGELIKSTPYFTWHYTPKDISFEGALKEYIHLLKTITKEQVGDKPVILALSGGLDSRSQALILKDFDNPVHGYSYAFDGGYPEHKISEQIAKVCHFTFDGFKIPEGYLWNCIDELADINGCYSEFTHPRQMAILPELKAMEGVFSLGHWGDVLFDRGAPEGTTEKDIIPLLFKKMVKPKGVELAEKLWQHWNLEDDFKSYLITRIETDLAEIKIGNISAKVRAYKTSQWAHRWTTTNLSVFEEAHPITLPFYDNRMCEFICSIPEAYLADRRLQLAHLKQHKKLANITWHAQRPYTINNYQYNKAPYNLPFRIMNKLQREAKTLLGKKYVQRNWELQFIGTANEEALKSRIFNADFNSFIPKYMVEDIYNQFKTNDPINYAHAVSMLLTLSLWHQKYH
ncbi:asparagine synthase-related protein [Xanthomarina sp. F2636L]|uniref:asparagine synthase-related protein n=1 Tax=Xanthomarina sp. F2636L TaxID=2996018 RepID=UPI00225E490A|nr:asparagine synthase-related protein [Xanthomarina sp. F2636L]MCX7549370.1 asparagine synthase-related protein [Xanthomarina sp. F2636L]